MRDQAISPTPQQQRGLAHLLADAAHFMGSSGDVRPQMFTGYERLVHKKKFWVGRLELANEAASSVIVKHVPPEHYPPDPEQVPPDLREEQLVYQYLMALWPEFDRMPQLWGQKPGLLVLEDLAPLRVEMAPEVRQGQLADTLARLHGVCGREPNLYHHLRHSAGLTRLAAVGYPSAELWFGFLEGMRELKSWCDLFALPVTDWANLIHTVRQVLQNPGPFLTLIHSELASPRNAFATRRGVCLLDFERATLGHALADIAIALIGHIEWKTSEQGYFLNHLYDDLVFAEGYRQKWESGRGESVSEAQWQHDLGAVLIFTAGLAIGSARRADVKYEAIRPFHETLEEILQRLSNLLQQLKSFNPLTDLLEKFVTHLERF